MNNTIQVRVALQHLLAREFSSPEELREYLKDHPGADPKKHRVVKKDEEGKSKVDTGLTSVKVKVDKSIGDEIKKVWKKQPAGNPLDGLAKAIGRGEGSEAGLEITNPTTPKDDVKAYKGLEKKLKEYTRK